MAQTRLPGIAFGVNLIFVFACVQNATVAVLAVVTALQPAILLVGAGPLLGEHPTARQIGWTLLGVVASIGVILGAGPELQASLLGVALAVCAMVTFTAYFVLTRIARSNTQVDPVDWMAGINVWSLCAVALPALVALRPSDIQDVSASDVQWLLVLALGTGIAGHVMMSWVHGYIEASRSSLYLLSMNVVAVGLAWVVHNESVTVIQGLCGLVVLFCVAMVIRLPRKSQTGQLETRPAPTR